MCFKIYKSNSDLKRHVSTVHDGKKFNCESCGATYTALRGLKSHIEAEHGENNHVPVTRVKNITFKCKNCDLSFSKKINYNTHINSAHNGKKQFERESCDSSYTKAIYSNVKFALNLFRPSTI